MEFLEISSFVFGPDDDTLFVNDTGRCYIYRVESETVSQFAMHCEVSGELTGKYVFYLGGDLLYSNGELLLVTSYNIYHWNLAQSPPQAKKLAAVGFEPSYTLCIPSVSHLLIGSPQNRGVDCLCYDYKSKKMLSKTTNGDLSKCHKLVLMSEIRPAHPDFIALTAGGDLVAHPSANDEELRLGTLEREESYYHHAYSWPALLYHRSTNCMAWVEDCSGVYYTHTAFGVQNHLDLSLLLSDEAQHHVFSRWIITFTHKKSGVNYRLPQATLKWLGIDRNLLSSWSQSLVSEPTLRRMIMIMYGMKSEITASGTRNEHPRRAGEKAYPVPIAESSKPTLPEALQTCLDIRLLHEIRMDSLETECVLEKAMKKLGSGALFDLFLAIWKECDKDELLVEMVVNALRPTRNIFLERANEVAKLDFFDAEFYLRVALLHASSTDLYSPRTATRPIKPVRSQLATCIAQKYKLCWKDKIAPSTLDGHPKSRYLFQIDGINGYIEVQDWIIYPQWKYFRNLLSSGMSESRSRIITLPSTFPLRLLLGILSSCHASYAPPLNKQDALFLLENAEEFCLVDDSLKPLPPFESLVESAVGHFLTKSSQEAALLQQLAECARVEHSELLDCRASLLVAKNWHLFTFRPELLSTLPMRWIPEVFALLKQRRRNQET